MILRCLKCEKEITPIDPKSPDELEYGEFIRGLFVHVDHPRGERGIKVTLKDPFPLLLDEDLMTTHGYMCDRCFLELLEKEIIHHRKSKSITLDEWKSRTNLSQ